MYSLKQTVTNLLVLALLVLAATYFAACSNDENPVSPATADNISGGWKGPFYYPDYYSGYLEMAVAQNDKSINETFHLYPSPGYSGEIYTAAYRDRLQLTTAMPYPL